MISDPELSLGETVKRPPIRYHGSKFTLAPWIISLFPEHRVYCEATRVILAQDSPETLHYVDPPYLQSTRESGGKGYACEMNEGEHAKLAFVLRSLKGKVVISGYPSAFYEQLYRGWRREEKEHYAGGQAGRIPRTEVLWLNF